MMLKKHLVDHLKTDTERRLFSFAVAALDFLVAFPFRFCYCEPHHDPDLGANPVLHRSRRYGSDRHVHLDFARSG